MLVAMIQFDPVRAGLGTMVDARAMTLMMTTIITTRSRGGSG